MNEGLQTMQPGGVRRLYIPGDLAFVKGLSSAPGRPRVPPLSPVVFDVKLVYIPGAPPAPLPARASPSARLRGASSLNSSASCAPAGLEDLE